MAEYQRWTSLQSTEKGGNSSEVKDTGRKQSDPTQFVFYQNREMYRTGLPSFPQIQI